MQKGSLGLFQSTVWFVPGPCAVMVSALCDARRIGEYLFPREFLLRKFDPWRPHRRTWLDRESNLGRARLWRRH